MREYKCIKDFYIEDVKFASQGDVVKLLQDGTTVVNTSGNQRVTNMRSILNNNRHFIEIKYTEVKSPVVEDKVSHPKHYTSHPSGIECIEITRHYCFAIGNAIKYLWRAGLKVEKGMTDKQKEIEDLEKAIWYIKDRVNQLKKDVEQ